MLVETDEITLETIPDNELPAKMNYCLNVFVKGEKSKYFIRGLGSYCNYKFNNLYVVVTDANGWDFLDGYIYILNKEGKPLEKLRMNSEFSCNALRKVIVEDDILKINIGDFSRVRGEIDISLKIHEQPKLFRKIRSYLLYRFFLGYQISFEKWLPWQKSYFELVSLKHTWKKLIPLSPSKEEEKK